MCTDLHCETQSLVYTEYNNGDSTHPCGALTLIVLIPENVLLILTTCFLFCKKSKIQRARECWIPNCFTSSKSLTEIIVLNADI